MTKKPMPAKPAAKKRTHPWRAWLGNRAVDARDEQKIVPYRGRLVRR